MTDTRAHDAYPGAEEIQQQLAPQLDMARDKLTDLNERFLEFAKERPVTTLIGALAAGFLLGKLVSRL